MNKPLRHCALWITSLSVVAVISPAHGKPVICSPNSMSTKVLAKPSASSPAKGWGPGNSIGTAWQLVKNKEEKVGGVAYIQGKLLSPFSPKAGYTYADYLAGQGQEVWGILTEWSCQ